MYLNCALPVLYTYILFNYIYISIMLLVKTIPLNDTSAKLTIEVWDKDDTDADDLVINSYLINVF